MSVGPERQRENSPPAVFPHLDVIREAVRAVPEVKWALGVVGVVSCVGLVVGGLKIQPLFAFFGFLVMVVFMTAMVMFARAVKGLSRTGGFEGKVFIWFSLLLFMSSATALFGSAVGNIPWPLRDRIQVLLGITPPRLPYTHEFAFSQPKFNVSMKNRFNYGESSLGIDPGPKGRRLLISKVRVEFDSENYGRQLCCDVWVYVGSRPFPFPSGGGQQQMDYRYSPAIIADHEGLAELKLKLVVGTVFGAEIPVGPQSFMAQYDFEKRAGDAVPKLVNLKDAFSNSISVDDALYAQVVIWEGQPGIDFDVTSIKLKVSGTSVPLAEKE